jgi:hypothetical protein
MLSRTFLASSLVLSALAFAAVGCSAAQDEAVTGGDADLTTSPDLTGHYRGSAATTPRQYATLALEADGTYAATVDVSDVADCASLPCLSPETGTWSTTISSGVTRLRLLVGGDAARVYDTTKGAAGELTLTTGGASQTLVPDTNPACCDPLAEPTGGIEGAWCCADGWQYDIGSGNHEMSCSSHGGKGRVCESPASSCVGAWRDQFGGCRSPNDGTYPESCCAGI